MIWLNYHWKSLIVIEKEISTNKWSNICFHRQMLLFNRANTMQMVLLFFSLGRFLSWSRFIIGTCRLSTLSTTVVVVVFLSRQLNLSSSLLDVYSTTSIKSTWDTLLNCIDRQNTDLITPPEHFSTHVRHITLSLFLSSARAVFCLSRRKIRVSCICSFAGNYQWNKRRKDHCSRRSLRLVLTFSVYH